MADDGKRSSRAGSVVVYTLLRLALFFGVWAILQFLTPVTGLWAAAAAILMSGAISLVLLDRQRNAAAGVAFGFFGRVNARIDASARAEDELESEPDASSLVAGDTRADVATSDDAPAVGDGSGEAEHQPEPKAVDQQ